MVRSVVDELRAETRRELRERTLTERVLLALELGELALEAYRKQRGVDRDTARGDLAKRRRAGRRPSRWAESAVE